MYYLETFETWCWRKVEKISWTDLVENEEVLHKVKGERNILHKIRRRMASWIGHILRRYCLLKHFIEGNIRKNKLKVRRRRRHKQLLNDLKERIGHCKLKDKVLDCTPYKTRFGTGCGPVVRQTMKWINILHMNVHIYIHVYVCVCVCVY